MERDAELRKSRKAASMDTVRASWLELPTHDLSALNIRPAQYRFIKCLVEVTYIWSDVRHSNLQISLSPLSITSCSASYVGQGVILNYLHNDRTCANH